MPERLSRAEEEAWQNRVHALHLAALEARRRAGAEERVFRNYIAERYGATPKPAA